MDTTDKICPGNHVGLAFMAGPGGVGNITCMTCGGKIVERGLDLEAIKARWEAAQGAGIPGKAEDSLDDIPALIAEVERLRAELVKAVRTAGTILTAFTE